MSNVIELTVETFNETIASGTVLVDFWAPWCAPCKQMLPILESIAGQTEATIAKVNVDEQADLAVDYSIRSIPALLVFKNGELAEQFNGLQKEADLLEALK